MKSKTIMLACLALICVTVVFKGCNCYTTAPKDPDKKPPTTVGEDRRGIKGNMIWDPNHPDNSERPNEFSVEFADAPGTVISLRDDGVVYINDERLIGGPGYNLTGVYRCTLGDKKLLCFNATVGSGICKNAVEIVDCDTRETIFHLGDLLYYDHYLFLRDEVLCVKKTDRATGDVLATGALAVKDGEICVVWDDGIDTSFDRAHTANPGDSVS